jgi:hypothetical protein
MKLKKHEGSRQEIEDEITFRSIFFHGLPSIFVVNKAGTTLEDDKKRKGHKETRDKIQFSSRVSRSKRR